jgi:hypothetical protein
MKPRTRIETPNLTAGRRAGTTTAMIAHDLVRKAYYRSRI